MLDVIWLNYNFYLIKKSKLSKIGRNTTCFIYAKSYIER
jgi:hypothetical protein